MLEIEESSNFHPNRKLFYVVGVVHYFTINLLFVQVHYNMKQIAVIDGGKKRITLLTIR